MNIVGASVYFDHDEWVRIERIAHGRKTRNQNVAKRTGSTSAHDEIIGVAAEIGSGILLGLDQQGTWLRADSPARGSGYQHVVCGRRVRVQGTEQPGHLLERADRVRADLYVLMWVQPQMQRASFVGWTTAGTLASYPTRTKNGPGWSITSHWVPSRDLSSFATLLESLGVAA